jgi:phosphatidylglycerophosphatase A
MAGSSLRGVVRLGNPIHLLAVGFGSGLSPRAPGTMGTLAAIPLWWLLSHLPLAAYAAVTLLVCVAGVWICDRAARDFGVHDHPAIVWDEIAGFLITMLMVPAGLIWVVAGFVLFRLFDIIKPWPIGWVDRHVGGGFGIMIDDVIAGVFAAGVMQILIRLV